MSIFSEVERWHGYNRVLALLVMRDLLSDDVWLSTNALYQQRDYTVARS
jgi:hypothetical protein